MHNVDYVSRAQFDYFLYSFASAIPLFYAKKRYGNKKI